MNLSSNTTYIFPSILLFLGSYLIVIGFNPDTIFEFDGLQFAKTLGLTVVLFFGLRLFHRVVIQFRALKYFLVLMPILVDLILGYGSIALALISGLFLLCSYMGYCNRFTAELTAEEIKYRNIFGDSGTIQLKDILKLEQKRSLLSIFREFQFLNIATKTAISFTDESLDEYEINVFMKAFKGHNLFTKIIENANRCGNLKIRQYTY